MPASRVSPVLSQHSEPMLHGAEGHKEYQEQHSCMTLLGSVPAE